MRYLSIVLSLLFVPAIAVAGGKLTPRPLDPIAAETFAHAIERSAIVRSLVGQLESSNVIVHIVTVPQMPAGIGGTTRFVTSRGGYRYLRITLAAGLPLRHRSGDPRPRAAARVRSGATRRPRRRGASRSCSRTKAIAPVEYFETRAAIEIERNVRLELRAARSLRLGSGQALQAEPVVKFDH